MRIVFPAAAALITLSLAVGALFLDARATFSQQPEVGRYQTALFGGQRRLHGLTYLLDTATGRTWVVSLEDVARGWTEVSEEEGKAPEASSVGRYRIDASYTGSPDGSERSVTVRVDTATGEVWQLPFTTRTMKWIQVREAADSKR
jgi:hypothetical protein